MSRKLTECCWGHGAQAPVEVLIIITLFIFVDSVFQIHLCLLVSMSGCVLSKLRCSHLELLYLLIQHFIFTSVGLFSYKVEGPQGGRTWQAFGRGKNGHETFRQARIYNFRDKCVVFARNLKFSNLTQ